MNEILDTVNNDLTLQEILDLRYESFNYLILKTHIKCYILKNFLN